MAQHTNTPAQTVSTRFSPDVLARLDEVAQMQNRPRSDIIKEAVDGYLNSMAWLEGRIQQGRDDLQNGRLISHEALKEKYRKLGINVD